MRSVVIGARGSALSRRQTQLVLEQLAAQHPDCRFGFKAIAASGDRQPEVSLVALGGEGIFVKELEAALASGEIDCAVHSLKDLPLRVPDGLTLAAVTQREDARDALVSRSGCAFDQLPPGATVGTSSPRRSSQLRGRRNDLKFADIRGNVETRLRKLQEGQYDAIVLAACGLIRLGLGDRISELLAFDVMLPEPGQGSLAIECRADDEELLGLMHRLDHAGSRRCVTAERAFLAALGGGCRVPIAAYGELQGTALRLDGVVAALDGSRQLRGQAIGPAVDSAVLGEQLAGRLRAQGAHELLSR